MTVRTVAVAVLALAAGAAGCGSGSDAACGRTQPCGGDLVGSWTIAAGCGNPGVAATELMTIVGGPCPTLTVDRIEDRQSGTFVFNADLTFTASASITGTITATIPASCIDDMPCAALETFLGLEGLMVHGCTGTSSCTCAIDRVPLTLDGAGTYVTGGSQVELRPEGTAILSKQYCVAGSTMHLTGVNGPTIVEDLVLERVTR